MTKCAYCCKEINVDETGIAWYHQQCHIRKHIGAIEEYEQNKYRTAKFNFYRYSIEDK
jgi:hypothetical protein